jgi:hypothetical protein
MFLYVCRLYLTSENSLSFHTLLFLGHEFDVGPVHVLLGKDSGELHRKHYLKLSVIFFGLFDACTTCAKQKKFQKLKAQIGKKNFAGKFTLT